LCKSCRTCFMFYCMFYFTCDRSFRQLSSWVLIICCELPDSLLRPSAIGSVVSIDDTAWIHNNGCKFSGNLVSGGNFRKFSLVVNINDDLGTCVDLSETMHATPMNTINHENSTCFRGPNVTISALLQRDQRGC